MFLEKENIKRNNNEHRIVILHKGNLCRDV